MKEKVKTKLFFEIENKIKQHLEIKNYYLVDIEIKGGKNKFLTIYLYKKDILDIDELGFLNRQLYPIIESMDFFKDGFNLEISSPGIFRNIKYPDEFNIFRERKIKIVTIEGESLTGISLGFNDDHLTLNIEGKNEVFSLEKIATAKLNG